MSFRQASLEQTDTKLCKLLTACTAQLIMSRPTVAAACETDGHGQSKEKADLEAIHLCEQLVDGLLALIIAAAHAGATVPAHRVDLVDEDDARRLGLGL